MEIQYFKKKLMQAAILSLAMSGVGHGADTYIEGKLRMGPPAGDAYEPHNAGTYSVALGYGASSAGNYSYALGYVASSGGDYSVALGRQASASGTGSYSLGRTSTASGSYSYALGYGSTSTKGHSFAFGYTAAASGDSSYAIGDTTVASGDFSYALGRQAVSTQAQGVAIGDKATVDILAGGSPFQGGIAVRTLSQSSANHAIAMGYSSKAKAIYSVALGRESIADGNYSVALSSFAQSPWFGSIVIGRYNVIPSSTPTQTWTSTEPLFVVGNGTATTSRSNALVVRKDGQTRIASSIDAKGVIRCAKAGDLTMGGFTGGPNPSLDLDSGLKYSGE